MASFEFILQRQRHDPFLFHCVILFSNILFGNTTEHQTQIHNQQTNTKQAKPENNQSEERKKEREKSKTNLVAPRPTLWGNTVAPYTLLFPWTASTPYMMGIPSSDSKASFWNPPTMSAQSDDKAFSKGPLPPPLRILPANYNPLSNVTFTEI